MVFQKPWRTRITQLKQDQCLRDAVVSRNSALVSLVLEEGNISAFEAKRHMCRCIREFNDVNILEMLLDTGAEAGELELKEAVELGNAKMVDILIQDGVKAFSKSIIEAARRGYTEILKKLLEAGGNPRTRSSYAINVAAQNGHADAVGILLDYGEEVTNIRQNVRDKVERLGNSNKRGYSQYSKILKILEEKLVNH